MLVAGGRVAQAADNGTSLMVSVLAPESPGTAECDGGGVTVNLDYSVVSTAAADSATIDAGVDTGESIACTPAAIPSGNITDGGGWTFSKRTKSADGSCETTLAVGNHTVTVCATQSGSQGRPAKTACGTATIEIKAGECAPEVCGGPGLGDCGSGCEANCPTGQGFAGCRQCCQCTCKVELFECDSGCVEQLQCL